MQGISPAAAGDCNANPVPRDDFAARRPANTSFPEAPLNLPQISPAPPPALWAGKSGILLARIAQLG
jgi:hypothetical protein